MSKVALITGITGQDGAYLADLLLEKNYTVHGLRRRISIFNTERIDHLLDKKNKFYDKFFLHYGDLSDANNLTRIINKIKPDEIYNLAAMSHVHISFDMPEYTANTDALGTLRILEAIRLLKLDNKTKVYQASTSELYGKVQSMPQSESTPFYPRSPYAVAKLYAYWITVNYREAYNIFCCNGILFNHESPIRGETFVTRKITLAIADILLGKSECFSIGNLSSKRDWGHAKDYVYGMWLMLQNDKPKDYVLATGKTTTVRDFIKKAFKCVDIDIKFEGKGINECAYIEKCNGEYQVPIGQKIIVVNKKYFRPTEVDVLIGDSSKAKKELKWETKITLEELIDEMLQSDINKKKKKYGL